MPYVSLTVAAEPSAELTGRIVDALTAVTVGVLRKEYELTSVVVQYVPPAHWARAGVTSAQSRWRRFLLEAKITAGSNSREEKARYIREAHDALAAILGERAAGYVALSEIAADSWGHAGETQESRISLPSRRAHVQGRPAQG